MTRPYVSIDIETTGLDPKTCQVLQIGAVVDDWETPVEELPTFNCYIEQGVIRGEPYALAMHAKIFQAMSNVTRWVASDGVSVCSLGSVTADFSMWLFDHGINSSEKMVVAGKNFAAFDRNFLSQLMNWDWDIKMEHRFIDPGNMYYQPGIDDGLPNTEECLRRAGLPPHVSHTAVEDALDVVRLIRWKRDNS
jgi:oligoribonuclease (3'-5' exoribonuclease)